ncbi:hypothetical protein electrica_04469 [Klebsiella electrica]|jgi:hypothetical protein|nr:hypothetical protein electrica_04469 [Klebsiella electrica]
MTHKNKTLFFSGTRILWIMFMDDRSTCQIRSLWRALVSMITEVKKHNKLM